MNLKIKKLIAREFLILIVVITVGLLSFICTYPYNWLKSREVKNLDEKIALQTHLADSLSISFINKTMDGKDYISRVYEALKENAVDFEMLDFNYLEPEFRQKILSDKDFRTHIYFIFQRRLEGFTKTKTEFENSINRQLTLKDINQNKQAGLIRTEINENKIRKEQILSSMLSLNDKFSFSVRTIIFIAIALFLLRYIFYAIRWSIRTIKNTETT